MAPFNRLILSAKQVGARKRQRSYLTDIIAGPTPPTWRLAGLACCLARLYRRLLRHAAMVRLM
jgi:hypothetical protein